MTAAIAAAHGGEIVKLAQTGQVLAHFPPPSAVDSTGQVVVDVPLQVALPPPPPRWRTRTRSRRARREPHAGCGR